MEIRRVVMGHDPSGKAVVLDDGPVQPVGLAMLPGFEIHRVWESEDTPDLPVTDPRQPSGYSFFPGPRGLRFGYLTIPPGASYVPGEGLDMAAAGAEMEAKLPGMAATFDSEQPGMHTTHTVDFIVAVSGEGRMQTDDGAEVHLRAGDCLIQNGTPHAWFNDGPDPFILCYALCGADGSASGDG